MEKQTLESTQFAEWRYKLPLKYTGQCQQETLMALIEQHFMNHENGFWMFLCSCYSRNYCTLLISNPLKTRIIFGNTQRNPNIYCCIQGQTVLMCERYLQNSEKG